MREFNKLHLIPAILQDFCWQTVNPANSPEVRENYVQKFEAVKEYCDLVIKNYTVVRHEELAKNGVVRKKAISSGL